MKIVGPLGDNIWGDTNILNIRLFDPRGGSKCSKSI